MSRKKGKGILDILIRCGRLLTMQTDQPLLTNMEVHIKGSNVMNVKPIDSISQAGGTDVIDATDCLVMPGLINCHTHAAMTLFRGLADDMPLKKWLFEKIFPAEAEHLSPDNVYWGAMLAMAEMVCSGTTCFSDGYFFQDKTVEAALEVGLRGIIAQGVIDFPAPGVPDPKENLVVGKQFIDTWKGVSDLIVPSLFCHSPVTCCDKTLIGAMELCLGEKVPMQIHLSETLEEVNSIVDQKGIRPTAYLDRIGVLNESLIAVHCVHVNEAEIGLIRDRGTKVVHCPESNMKLASGVCPVHSMVNMDIDVGVGTDGCASNNDLDMFKEIDTAAKLSKVFTRDPTTLKAERVLELATVGGARVLGLENEIGTIEVGKKADIIVIDLGRPHLQPVYDAVSTLVYSAIGGDVRDVIVNGKLLMRNRELTTIDIDKVLCHVKRIAKDIQK